MRSFADRSPAHSRDQAGHPAVRLTQATVHLSATAIDNVRGVLATAHLFCEGVESATSTAYRKTYRGEPFVRIVKERTGVYRYPEPKILSGSNYADVGFEVDGESRRIVALGAIDNLMKGGGDCCAVHEFDDGLGRDDRAGLSRSASDLGNA